MMKMMLDNELHVLLLLYSLLDSWKTLIISLNNSAPNGDVVTLGMVRDRMLNNKIRKKKT